MGAVLPVAEVFGPVWQGEGPSAGRRCAFVRLGLCNLSCEWCDTPYTWDRTRYDVDAECPDTDVGGIIEQVETMGVPMVVLSGGEPLIHQQTTGWASLLAGLSRWTVHVETNGTIAPTRDTKAAVDLFVVSPKVSTHDPAKRRLNPVALSSFAYLAQQDQAAWKFVCQTPGDVATAAALCDEYGVPAGARWAMPEGVTPEAVLSGSRYIADAVTRHGFNLSLRTHALMYGAARGV